MRVKWIEVGLLIIFFSLMIGCERGSERSDTETNLPPLPVEASPNPDLGVIFTDVSEAAGIRFIQSFGDTEFSNLIEAVGSGAVFLDFDQDGWLDLYFATGKYVAHLSEGEQASGVFKNRLYRNRKDGTFEDVTDAAGVGAEASFTMGLAAGDYDNDGWPDLYLCNYQQSILYHNDGDGTFSDVTQSAGVSNTGQCSVAATWLDYDRDGLLDLYVSSYIDFDPDYAHYYSPDGFPGPLAYNGQPERLYRNLGDGRFQDVSGMMGLSELEGRGMSVATIDYNEDNFPDLYVTNDASENFLLRNESARRFVQVALESGVGYNGMGDSTASMGVDFGDYDGDGHFDLFVSDNSLSSLYKNEGDGLFLDVVVESGIAMNSAQFIGWGSFFFDFDNDGDLDILEVNSDLSRLFGQEDQLFENYAGGKFRDVSQLAGEHFDREFLSRGAAFGDYDNDGDLDVVIVNIGGPALLLRNDGGNQNNWLLLSLRGNKSNRDALGTLVKLTVNGRPRLAYKKGSTGYLSQSDPRLHFGLGDQEDVERLEIQWPSGTNQIMDDVPANQILFLTEPTE